MAHHARSDGGVTFLDHARRHPDSEHRIRAEINDHKARMRPGKPADRPANLILTSFGPDTFSTALIDLLTTGRQTQGRQNDGTDVGRQHSCTLEHLVSCASLANGVEDNAKGSSSDPENMDQSSDIQASSNLKDNVHDAMANTNQSTLRTPPNQDHETSRERFESFERHATHKRRAIRERTRNHGIVDCKSGQRGGPVPIEHGTPDNPSPDQLSTISSSSRPVANVDPMELSQNSSSNAESVYSNREASLSFVDTLLTLQPDLARHGYLYGYEDEAYSVHLYSEAEARAVLAGDMTVRKTTQLSYTDNQPSTQHDGLCSDIVQVLPLTLDYSNFLPSAISSQITRKSADDMELISREVSDEVALSTQMSLVKVDRSTLPHTGRDDFDMISFTAAIDTPEFVKLIPAAGNVIRSGFPTAFWDLIPRYLSSQEIRTLRLVNKKTAHDLASYMFRSAVVKFGPAMFDIKHDSPRTEHGAHAGHSMFQRFGKCFNKFGISFEYDLLGLVSASPKTIDQQVSSWFGSYVWPKQDYPYFKQLLEQENLVNDNTTLLKDAMSHLENVSELALSLDSGHGWLGGGDISDLALWDLRHNKGTRVFGKSFDAEDARYAWALRQYFQWAQMNTLDVQKDVPLDVSGSDSSEPSLLSRIQVREYDDYSSQVQQPDMDADSHVGGASLRVGVPPNPPPHVLAPGPAVNGLAHAVGGPALLNPIALLHLNLGPMNPINAQHPFQPPPPMTLPFIGRVETIQDADGNVDSRLTHSVASTPKTHNPVLLQWPIIFNCFNLSAQAGGRNIDVVKRVASPADLPLRPGELTEAQAQWLMETLWAQRVFISAYTNSVINNAGVFSKVHSLHISKVSANMLPSLAQREFWSSLQSLRCITLLVVPDWRQTHVLGDPDFNTNMLINPVLSSSRFARFLNEHIATLENLSSLTIGFVGGGEHATGTFARNNHVLPAPIVYDCKPWLTDHAEKPDARDMVIFNHVRTLKFQNCWFSPCMLQTFMRNSRDTSLHHLVLDSVSLTGRHDTRLDDPISVERHNLRCEYDAGSWLEESLPRNACWVKVLDEITPGITILTRKYEAHMINEEENPRPSREFRGNIETINLVSCGYVRIAGVEPSHFSQNGLVSQSRPSSAFDRALELREFTYKSVKRGTWDNSPFFVEFDSGAQQPAGDNHQNLGIENKCVMMGTVDPSTRTEWLGLGKLTCCVHPVEKRVLEGAWGMRFGWGDNMDRFRAVEDGCFEGGTGRFSGQICKTDGNEGSETVLDR